VTISKEFDRLLAAFEKFSKDSNLGPLEPNQWEISYTNHIPKGELWELPGDWSKVIPHLALPAAVTALPDPSPISLDWRYVFAGERGRLFVTLQHARSIGSAWNEDFMQLTLTARGPIDSSKDWTLSRGFDLGHEAIVRTFTDMTSAKAHEFWKRRT
jgi:hypothetical protein